MSQQEDMSGQDSAVTGEPLPEPMLEDRSALSVKSGGSASGSGQGEVDSPVTTAASRKSAYPPTVPNLPQGNMQHSKIEMMENSLRMRIESFGKQDPGTVQQWKRLLHELNQQGLGCLQEEDYDEGMRLFNRAKTLITAKTMQIGDEDDRKKQAAITLNNIACLYLRKGLYKIALQHAEMALRIECTACKWDNPAATHLNMAAILNKLGRHDHALQHCQCAIELVSQGYTGSNSPRQEQHAHPQDEGLPEDTSHNVEDNGSVAAAAYFNLGVELEALARYEESLSAYEDAVQVATRDCGQFSITAKTFRTQVNSASARVEQLMAEKHKQTTSHAEARGVQVPSLPIGKPKPPTSARSSVGQSSRGSTSARQNFTRNTGQGQSSHPSTTRGANPRKLYPRSALTHREITSRSQKEWIEQAVSTSRIVRKKHQSFGENLYPSMETFSIATPREYQPKIVVVDASKR